MKLLIERTFVYLLTATLFIMIADHGVSFESPPHVVFKLSSHAVDLSPLSLTGHFESKKTVKIKIGSHSAWRIFCIAENPQGPGNAAISTADIFTLPNRNPENPAKHYTGPPISLEKFSLIAQGKETRQRIIQANTLTFSMVIPPLLPPGNYKGVFNFYLNGHSKDNYLDSLTYNFHHDPIVSIVMAPDKMDFGNLLPGTHQALCPIAMAVTTNVKGLRFTINLLSLQQEKGTGVVPTSHLCLAGGASSAEVVRRAKHTKFGSCEVEWEPLPGSNTLFLFGRAEIAMDMIPGNYHGLINVDYQFPGNY